MGSIQLWIGDGINFKLNVNQIGWWNWIVYCAVEIELNSKATFSQFRCLDFIWTAWIWIWIYCWSWFNNWISTRLILLTEFIHRTVKRFLINRKFWRLFCNIFVSPIDFWRFSIAVQFKFCVDDDQSALQPRDWL